MPSSRAHSHAVWPGEHFSVPRETRGAPSGTVMALLDVCTGMEQGRVLQKTPGSGLVGLGGAKASPWPAAGQMPALPPSCGCQSPSVTVAPWAGHVPAADGIDLRASSSRRDGRLHASSLGVLGERAQGWGRSEEWIPSHPEQCPKPQSPFPHAGEGLQGWWVAAPAWKV